MWMSETVIKICPGGCVGTLLVGGKVEHPEVHTSMSPHFQYLNVYCLVIRERVVYREL